jgi:hypothetical protein
MAEIVLTLVTGNASWWKQRKYRRETAHRLRRLRAKGWSLAGFRRLASAGVDTRRWTAYDLRRRDPGGAAAPAAADGSAHGRRAKVGAADGDAGKGMGGTGGEDRAVP